MDLSATQRGQYRVAFSRPASLPGVTVGQFRSDGHLFTCELLLSRTEDGRTRIIDGTPRAGDAA